MHKKIVLSMMTASALMANSAQAPVQKFVPDISLITDFSYNDRSVETEKYEALEMPGLTHSEAEGHDHGHDHGGSSEGFNLNYAELAIGASVDHRFDLFSTFHLSESAFEIEEAFIKTRGLGYGLDAKIGKFLSGIGRINPHHSHTWSFDASPMVYEAFLGDHGLLEKGVQLTWVAPTDTYLQVGVEMLQGENETSFGVEEFHIESADGNESDEEAVEAADKPAMTAAFVKTSFDAGDLTTLLGLSHVSGASKLNHEDHGFDGTTTITGLDLTLKYMLDSYASVTWQSEYLQRTMDGDLIKQNPADDADVFVKSMEKSQAGYYTQLVYRMDKEWQAGVRYESILENTVKVGGTDQKLEDEMSKSTVVLDYNPSHFSRIRFQYAMDDSKYMEVNGEDKKEAYTEFSISFNMAIGAHGAHSF